MDTWIPLIITSPGNREETAAFFREHRFFGIPEQDVTIFTPSVLPAVDFSGRLLVASPSRLALAPADNGDCFGALARTGILGELKRRGVEWLFYHNVDNARAKPADPAFLRMAASRGCPVATKALEKRSADEKLGVLCLRNGRPCVIEIRSWRRNRMQLPPARQVPVGGLTRSAASRCTSSAWRSSASTRKPSFRVTWR